MLSQVVINQGNFALQNRAENVVQTVVHCFSIISTNKLKINKITPLSQGPLGSLFKTAKLHKALIIKLIRAFSFISNLHFTANWGSVLKPCGYVMLICESELSLRKIKKITIQ